MIWKVRPSLVVFFFLLPRLRIILSRALFCLLFSVHLWMQHACHHLFCWSQCTVLEYTCFKLAQYKDALRYVLLLWKCFIHWSFGNKITDSNLGPAFLSISMVWMQNIVKYRVDESCLYQIKMFHCWLERSRNRSRPHLMIFNSPYYPLHHWRNGNLRGASLLHAPQGFGRLAPRAPRRLGQPWVQQAFVQARNWGGYGGVCVFGEVVVCAFGAQYHQYHLNKNRIRSHQNWHQLLLNVEIHNYKYFLHLKNYKHLGE